MFIILAFLVSCIVQSLYVHGILLEPEQIHLAVGRTPDYMAVQWAVIDEFCTTGTYVQYGLSSDALTNQVYGLCYPFDLNSQKIQKQSNHVAYMTNLKPSTKYFYRVGDLTRWSQIYSFKSLPDATTISNNLPQRFLIFGDLAGSNQAPSDSCTTMPWMSVEAANGDVDMTLQLGDLAYDLNTDGGLVGRQFMNEIQNMSAIVPFMIAHGNHESAFNYAYSTEFFRSHPSNLIDQTVTTFAGSAPNNWYYSFNVGLIHFVVVQVELILGNSNIVPSQWNWLKQDLEIANNNRTQAPWIIVSGHRSLYCSSDNDCNGDAFKLRQGIKQANGTYLYGLEDLFYTYGVDMYFNGHEHNYERMYDVAPKENGDWTSGYSTQSTVNPPATTYIVHGSAGNAEDHKEFELDQPSRTAFRSDRYGYGRMQVYNASHLYWEQVECDLSDVPAKEGVVIDSFWLIQHNHGSFKGK